ncbi:MAG: hypothetical protein P4L31_03995 [Candidatus Babeliales bacterium]|nr:hypothetical protein [Candidatus Babeliales bacterium]
MKQLLARILIMLSIGSYCLADLHSDFQQAYTLNKQGNILQACQLYRMIVKQHEWCTQAIYNLAHTLKDLSLMTEAIDAYTIVINREPTNSFAHLGLSQCFLSLGDYHRGFELFEWRSSDVKAFKHDIEKLKRLVTSNADLAGLKVLLRSEWGLGDTIQFIRFAQLLKQRGATIMVQSYPALKEMFSLCPFLDKVISVGDAFPEHDIQIPLLSLAYVCDATVNTIQKNYAPYLFANNSLVQKWEKELKSDTNFKVGICWCGKGDTHAPPLLNKNISLAEFLPLTQLENVTVYSLQQQSPENYALAQLKKFDDTFDQLHGGFSDTAAVMHNLDLIITIDTSIAHLAGAMNIPVWILLPYKSDWRWMIDGDNSPWYPSMKLFRQSNPDDSTSPDGLRRTGWKSVIAQVIKEIKKKVE